ncbi:MAG: fused MFS/spermidine synthase [Candidatus Bathyarchaeia archaeon]
MRSDWLLRVQVFIAGAAVLSLEILGSRLLSPHFGSSLFVWGSLIGVVLTALSLGYYYGGRISDRGPSRFTFSLTIFAAGAYILFITVLSPSIFDVVLTLKLGERFGPLAATIFLLAIPSFLLGMVSPYAIRLKAAKIVEVGSTAGNLFALSTAGSIVGTFVTVFFLIPEFEVTRILIGTSILLMIVSVVSLSLRAKSTAVVFIGIALAVSFTAPTTASGVIYEKESLYHHIVVVDNTITQTRTLILDNNFHSATHVNDPTRTIYTYTDYFHFGILLNPQAKNVLFVGGGGLSGPKKFLNDYERIQVYVVEIDRDVLAVAKKFFFVEDSPNLHIHESDGRVFLATSEQKYDIIVLDAFARTYIPFHLMTKEFFEEIDTSLTEDGVVVSNIIASIDGPTSLILKSEIKTMSQVFPNVYVFPVSTLGPSAIQNVIVVATKSPISYSKADVVEIAKQSTVVKIPEFVSYASHYYEERIDTSDAHVLTDNFAPVENLVNPLTGTPFLREEASRGSLVVEGSEVPQSQILELNLPFVLAVIVAAGSGLTLLVLGKRQGNLRQMNA